MKNKYYSKAFLICLFSCGLIACNNDAGQQGKVVQGAPQTEVKDWATTSLPDISQQPVRLRVANVVNPRFEQLSEKQISQILVRSQQLVKQYFDIDVEFSETRTLSIKDVFGHLSKEIIAERQKEIVDIDFIDKQVRENMQQALFKTLTLYRENMNNVIEFAQPYLIHPEEKQKNFIELSYALTDTLISRLGYWKKQVASDGYPVLDSNGYHQWVWWDSLGYGNLPYDVVITNQLVASAEYYGMDVHSSIRGGLTAGTTTYDKNTQFNGYAYIMVYPMLNDTDLLTTLRQDESYTEKQIVDYSAALLSHELGHLLLHLGHPFGNRACIMSPTVMLNYRDWYGNLDASRCAVGSSKDMQPGAVELEYNRRW
ncbi:MAG TPA: hypothetical protein ENJ87_12085 [Gammaproteobacteria bacterium]|nr:hypothetical protein [Gammaproteobacteria bacterium]